MTKEKAKRLQEVVDRFNRRYSVGTKVRVRKDLGEVLECVVKYPAEVLGGHTPVGWFTNVGCYLLSRVSEEKQ